MLIGLSKIGELELLRAVFGKVSIPREFFREVAGKGPTRSGAKTIKEAEWIKITEIKDRSRVNFLLGVLDKGEAEVLALAKEAGADLVLLDEEKARKLAVIAGFDVMGLLGLFVLAKNMGLVDRIRPIIDELRRKKFRISDRIVAVTLEKAGE